MRLLAICISFSARCLFRSFPCFLIGLFVLLILSSMSCLHILENNPLSVASFVNIYSHSECDLFFHFWVPLLFKSFQGRNKDEDVAKGYVVKGWEEEGGMNWEIRFDICTLSRMK